MLVGELERSGAVRREDGWLVPSGEWARIADCGAYETAGNMPGTRSCFLLAMPRLPRSKPPHDCPTGSRA